MLTAAIALALSILLAGRRSASRLGRSGPAGPPGRSRARRPEPAGRGDPLAEAAAFDLLAVCLGAGMPVPVAARAVAASAPATLAGILRRAADLLALGADPATAWALPLDEPAGEQCQALLRLARRSAASGAALADGVVELGAAARIAARHHAAAAAERAGVLIAGPLGVCFLPSFICLGVVPVVAGLAADLTTPGLW